MVVRPAARRLPSGDCTIQTVRSEIPRLVTGGVALALLAGVGAVSAFGAPLAWPGALIGLLLVLAGLAAGRVQPCLWGVGVVAATYVGSLYLRNLDFDPLSLLVALALLASSELAQWSTDSRVASIDEVSVHLKRAWWITIVLGLALALGALVEGFADVGSLGTVAAAAATGAVLLGLALLTLAVWRGRTAET